MQEYSAVVSKEMSFRRTFCLWLAIFILVHQKIFVCADQCNCRCERHDICDEINRLASADDTHDGLLRMWNQFLPYIQSLHRSFDEQDWNEKIISIQHKIKSIDVLEERLDVAETRAEWLRNALENSMDEFKNTMSAFEQKLQDVQIQAMMLDRKIYETDKKIAVTQEELLLNISSTFSEVALKYEELKENIHLKLIDIEGDLKSSIEEEKKCLNTSEGAPVVPGLLGAPGLKGYEGPEELMGQKGEKGEQGLSGPTEPKGDRGLPGIPGSDGLPGLDGHPAAKGPRGPPGIDGYNGTDGPPGLVGFPGERVPRGFPGSHVNKGEKDEPAVEHPGLRRRKRKAEELQRNYENSVSGEGKLRPRIALERPVSEVRKPPSTVEDKATPLE